MGARMSFLLGQAAWLFLLTIPLVVLYFLKLKRPRLVVPSLVLWQRVLADSRVNSPLQRFKRNILLFLQLLLLALLVLAAMQPYFSGGSDRASRLPVLIDCSASMGALDKPGGVTRLAAASAQVEKLIDNLLPDQQLCLVAFAQQARKLTGFTNDKRLLRDALRSITVQDVPGSVEDALRLTQALARATPFERVLLYSDGNFPAQTTLDLAFKLDYQQLEPGGANLGITTLGARRAASGRWELFLAVQSNTQQPAAARLEVLQDGNVIATQDLAAAAGAPQRWGYEIAAPAATVLHVRLKPDGFDALAADNDAWISLSEPRAVQVFCPPSLAAQRFALGAIPDLNLHPAAGEEPGDPAADRTAYDLVVTDKAADLQRSAPMALSVGVVPDDLLALVSVGEDGTAVVDWTRGHPLLQYVELADLVIMDNPRSAPDVREADYEQLGYEVIVHGQAGPLLLQRRTAGRLAYHLLFHTDRSTLPYRIGFPVLLHNAVKQAMQASGLAEIAATRTGVLPPLSLSPGGQYAIAGPQEMRRADQADERGLLRGIPAPHVGAYIVSANGAEVARVSASLLDANESSLEGTKEIQFTELSVSAAAQALPVDRSLWPTLAAIALAVLCVEWWWFNKRVSYTGVR
jgi:hypothetical protein